MVRKSHVLDFTQTLLWFTTWTPEPYSRRNHSPVVSRLFPQGRHRNASVILLLQNMFPKGKYNTDISRNAQYLALFRSPSDRKQIGIIGERMFDENRVHFMNAYFKETEKPFGYLLVDNKPCTPADKQIVADLLGKHSLLESIVKIGLDFICLFRLKTVHSNNPPWLTPKLSNLIKNRQTALRAGNMMEFKRLRNQVNQERKSCRSKFYLASVHHFRQCNPSTWWSEVKKLS